MNDAARPLPQLTADMPISAVPGLKTITRAALIDAGYETVRDVSMANDAELLRKPGFGKACLRNLREVIPYWIETAARDDRCERCRFWDGRCHKHAPRAGTEALFPTTAPAEWCGDFVVRSVPNPPPPADYDTSRAP